MANPHLEQLSEGRFRTVVVLALVVLGFLAYSSTFTGEFVWDDASSVLLHEHVQDPSKLFQLFREDQHAFGRGQGNFYRPLVAATFMLDFALSYDPAHDGVTEAGLPKVSPFVFHVTNTLWHVAAALFLFALLTRLKAPAFVRAVVPAIYVLHPLHTEAVAYISGRADMMSAVFIYAGLWCALWEGTRGKRIAGAVLSALCFCGGLLSKESTFIFPFLLLLVVVARPVENHERNRAHLWRLLPLGLAAVVFALYSGLRLTVLHFASTQTVASPLPQRLVEMLQAFAYYVRLLFVPTGLHMERTLEGATWWTAAAGATLLVLLLAILVVAYLNQRHRVVLGLAWFLIAWIPISGVFPLNAPMAEHWMYVPMAGFFWALAELLWEGVERAAFRRAVVAAAYAACVGLLVLTVLRNIDWQDNERLFVATLAENPKSVRVHYNLAVTYEDLLGNLPGARRHYQAVVDLHKAKKKPSSGPEKFWDDELESHLSLGRIYMNQRQYQAAAGHYATVLRVTPDDRHAPMLGSAAFGLGKCFLAFGDVEKARDLFARAASFRPDLHGAINAESEGTGTL